MNHTPKSILGVLFLASLVLMLSALAGVIAAGLQSPPMWFLLGFEVVVLAASFFGVASGLGKIKDGPALTMLIVGGCVIVAAVLSEPALGARLLGRQGVPLKLGNVEIMPFAFGRIAVGLMLMALAGLTVLVRRPGVSLPLLVRGVLLAVPLVLVLGAMRMPGPRGMLLSLPPVAVAMIGVVGFFVLGSFFAASVHCIIRSFEVGIESGQRTSPQLAPNK